MINMNNEVIKNIINLFLQNNFLFGNQFALNLQSQINHNIFLQKKRFLETSNLNYNNMLSFQKDTNYCISNKNHHLSNQKNEFLENHRIFYGITPELIRPFSYGNYNYNLDQLNCNNFNFYPNFKGNNRENYGIITNKYDVNNNLFGNVNSDILSNNSELKNDKKIKSKENLNDNFIENNNFSISNNLFNHSNILFDHASNSIKNNYFNVIHIKNEKR